MPFVVLPRAGGQPALSFTMPRLRFVVIGLLALALCIATGTVIGGPIAQGVGNTVGFASAILIFQVGKARRRNSRPTPSD